MVMDPDTGNSWYLDTADIRPERLTLAQLGHGMEGINRFGGYTVRPITVRVGVLPRVHGSALFTRGETQALVVATLGTARDGQIIDTVVTDDPPAVPRILSATGFMDTAIAGIRAANSSTQAAAEARFQEIIEGAKNYAGTSEIAKRIRYVHERYAKAATFNRAVVAGMLALFRAAGVASLTTDEEAGIINAWPEG
jgi:hypothetical protein